MPGAHTEALNAVFTESEAVLGQLARLWRTPELSAEEASARAEAVRAKLTPIVEGERAWLQKARDKLEKLF